MGTRRSGQFRLGMGLSTVAPGPDLTTSGNNLGGGGPRMPSVPNNAGTRNPVRIGNAVHPSVAFLVILILLEYAALGGLRYLFRHAHGG